MAELRVAATILAATTAQMMKATDKVLKVVTKLTLLDSAVALILLGTPSVFAALTT